MLHNQILILYSFFYWKKPKESLGNATNLLSSCGCGIFFTKIALDFWDKIFTLHGQVMSHEFYTLGLIMVISGIGYTDLFDVESFFPGGMCYCYVASVVQLYYPCPRVSYYTCLLISEGSPQGDIHTLRAATDEWCLITGLVISLYN